MYSILEFYGVKPHICLPEGPSKLSKRVLQLLDYKISYSQTPQPEEYDLVIVVDTANPAQLGECSSIIDRSKTILIDHHTEGDLRRAPSVIADLTVKEAASTSEIVSVVAERLGLSVPRWAALALASGIIVDTRWLRLAGIFTYQTLAYLQSRGVSIPLLMKYLREEQGRDVSERIALLKAASRLQYARICRDILIAVSHIGSFEASAARALLDLGADIAVVVRETKEGFRVSIRTSKLAESSGLDALLVARLISEKFGGEAGGHPSAAGVVIRSGPSSPEELANSIARSLPGKLSRVCVEKRSTSNGERQ